jgi:hypothetical protein
MSESSGQRQESPDQQQESSNQQSEVTTTTTTTASSDNKTNATTNPPVNIIDEEADIKKKINDDKDIPENEKSALLQRILDKLNIKTLTPAQKDALLKEEIEEAKKKVKEDMIEFKVTNSLPKLTAEQKFGFASVIATGLAGIAERIMRNPTLMTLAVSGAGVVFTNPVGASIVVGIALCAVAYYAHLAVKAKFQGFYKILRTLDEFTILLEKIQRMLQITVFISGTYNFQINVDEITNQIKIILTRFEKTLTDVDIKQIQSQATDAKNLEKLNEDTAAAANSALMNESDLVNAEHAQDIKDNTQTPQGGGGFIIDSINKIKLNYKKFSFPVEEWNRNLLDDITKLNIRLTTAMGEFTIILNVIQMNMIADGINETNTNKIKAIAVFVEKITKVKSSSEYKRMRIGILLNDILALKVDFDFCQQGSSRILLGTKPDDDTICLEYTETDTAGNRITNFRPKLHHMIILLCETLKNGEGYDAGFINVVKTNIIDPYIELLKEAKFSNSTATIANTLKSLKIEPTSLSAQDKADIDKKLDELIDDVNKEINKDSKVQGGGGFRNFFSKKDNSPAATANPTPAQVNIIKYLKKSPTNIISEESFKAYLDAVYKFSKEISKPTKEESKESRNNVSGSVVDPAAGTSSAGPANAVLATTGPATGSATTGPATGSATTGPATGTATTGPGGGRRHTRKKPRKPKMSKAKSYKYRVRL